MTEQPGADAALAATPGATLAAARKASGLSVAQVAEQMRISPRQVEAIEADRYGDLPGAVFVRGFVRNYARLLRVDPEPLMHALEPQLATEVPLRAHEIAGALPETTRRGGSRVWLGLIVVLLTVVAVGAAYEWWRDRERAQTSQGSGGLGGSVVTKPLPAPAAKDPMQETVPLTPEPLSEAPGAGSSTDARPQEAPAASAQAPDAPPAQPQTAQPSAAPAAGSVRMQMQATDESWIEVRDGAGEIQFSGTLPAGSERTFEAASPVDVVVGNASGVRITYNGKPFDVGAHASRNIARFRLE